MGTASLLSVLALLISIVRIAVRTAKNILGPIATLSVIVVVVVIVARKFDVEASLPSDRDQTRQTWNLAQFSRGYFF